MEQIFSVLANIQDNLAKIAAGIEEGNESKRQLAYQVERLGNLVDRQLLTGTRR